MTVVRLRERGWGDAKDRDRDQAGAETLSQGPPLQFWPRRGGARARSYHKDGEKSAVRGTRIGCDAFSQQKSIDKLRLCNEAASTCASADGIVRICDHHCYYAGVRAGD